ncbi:MAG: Gldg family protein, partial [Candidatus Aminicenantaceae bacterium]
DGGYSQAKAELEKLAYDVKKLSLALPDTFPADVDLLIIPGPQKDLFPDEIETIRNFLHKAGRVFFMIDPQTAPGLSPFLAEFGVKLEDDVIVDTVSRLMGGDYFMPVVSEYEYHDITSKFRYATFFPFARSVDTTEEKPEGISITVLARTSQNSWSERQLEEQQVAFNEETDKAGPIPLALVATIEYKDDEAEKESAESEEIEAESGTEVKEDTPQDKDKEESGEETRDEKPRPEGRLAVFGDSEFVSNRYYYTSGNGNFFLNTAAWLTEEADLISIQPNTASPKTIQLTPSQGRMIFFVSLIILPLAVLVTGTIIWARRKSL